MRGNSLLIIAAICCVSCSSSFLKKDSLKNLTSSPVIGYVGVYNGSLLSNTFVESGVAKLESQIRLSVQKREFNQATLKKYNEKIIDKLDHLEIIDSINLRPTYYNLKISDEVGFINNINAQQNKNLNNYLNTTKNNVIVSEVLIYFPEVLSQKIESAKELYLINLREGNYSIEVIDFNNNREVIEFSQGISFGFDFKTFCWRENYRKEPVIASLKNLYDNCPGSTKSNPDKVKSKDAFDRI